MVSLSVSVPDDLRERMAKLNDINWSAVARHAFEERVKEIDILKAIASKSKLTEKDALEIGRKINASMAKRFRQEHPDKY